VAGWLALGALFVIAATANGAGYRYGVSDQAFYIPVIVRALDPGLFPRDAALIDAQGQLMVLDELVAWFANYTGWPLDGLFLTGYLISLFLIWCGVVLIGTRVFASPWATLALGAALTLRHRIPRTSANSLEPYFHPRMLAFGAGLLAIGALLRRAPWVAVGLVAVSGMLHPTMGLWFAVMIGTALIVLGGVFRRLAVAGGAAAVALLTWAATAGPLREAAVRMDDVWLQAVASKDSLFATDWPVWAWAANLASVAIAWAAHSWRTRRGLATPEDRALVWGAMALAALFLVTLPLVAAGYSLLVQFQISRVFWLIEFVAVLYTIAVIADAPVSLGRSPRRAIATALVLVAFAAGRGAYIMLVERPERALFERRVPDSPWEEVMRWLAWQPRDVHVLADPGHAWKFGTSVRVSAEHDVFIEEVKDSALAIYSRNVAVRFVERTTALGDFAALDAERARALARQYDLHYLVAEHEVALPVAYRNRQFRIYSLR
jgi:hypothetical protein